MKEIRNIVGYDKNKIQEHILEEKERIKENEKASSQIRIFLTIIGVGFFLKGISLMFGTLPAVIGNIGLVMIAGSFLAYFVKWFTYIPYTPGDNYKLFSELENRELLKVHLKSFNAETAVVILTLEDKDKNIIKKEMELDCICDDQFEEITLSLNLAYIYFPSAGTKYWANIEEKVEGKEILTLSANDIGCIIRFTDGSMLKYIYGTMEYIEKGDT